jgi:hypothetical protein
MDPVVKDNGEINQWAETLVGYENGKLPPIAELAESYGVSDDGTTYRFTLKQGVTFQDGSDLTASDFVSAWERLAQSSKTQNNDNMLGGTFTIAHELEKEKTRHRLCRARKWCVNVTVSSLRTDRLDRSNSVNVSKHVTSTRRRRRYSRGGSEPSQLSKSWRENSVSNSQRYRVPPLRNQTIRTSDMFAENGSGGVCRRPETALAAVQDRSRPPVRRESRLHGRWNLLPNSPTQ